MQIHGTSPLSKRPWAFVLMALWIATSEVGAGGNSSPWSAPENLGPTVNSEFSEQGPAITNRGRSLYFGSDRPGGIGGIDIWVSQRPSRREPWGAPMNVSAVNSPFIDNIPWFSPGGHWMFFNSNRPGGSGDVDIWAAWRPDPEDDFGWEPPVNLGATVNSPSFDGGVSYLRRGRHGRSLLYFASGRPPGTRERVDIYVSEQGHDGSFGPPVLVSELNSEFNDARPSVRSDGRELFFFSNRPGSALSDLWTSTRRSISHPWSPPVNLGATVNTAFGEFQPHIAPDARTLYFISDRPGGFGLLDLYVTTRRRPDKDDHDNDDHDDDDGGDRHDEDGHHHE